MTSRKFANVKKQALFKWNISFTDRTLAREWWELYGKRYCSFCKVFTKEEIVKGRYTMVCGLCPLKDDKGRLCCKEWLTISRNYNSNDFLEIINKQSRLLYLRIEAIQYNPKWKDV